MKVKVLSRNPDDYQRETNKDIHKLVRNWNAPEDPFQAQTEYTRAMNATKLERVFAKPFVASFDGHMEGVNVLAKHPDRPSTIISGARDGQVKIWNLANKQCLSTIQAHVGNMTGLSVDLSSGTGFITVGLDQQVKFWNLGHPVEENVSIPLHSVPLAGVAHGVSHLAKSSDFAVCGEGVDIWKPNRNTPIRKYNVGPNTVHAVKGNPIEEAVILGCASDRSIFVIDSRQKNALRTVTMKLRSNAIAWNPIEAYTFAVCSDDYNSYSFDMRYMAHPKYMHGGHGAAVIDIDYSPTGKEIVTGSFDKTIRIFGCTESRSRDVYHTGRMSTVLSVLWSMDNKFVLCGSNEMNIRIWKAKAAEKIGPLAPREKSAFAYSEKLRDQYKDHPEIRRIARHRQLPGSVFHARKEHDIIRKARSRKELRRRENGEEAKPFVPMVQQSMADSSK
ncbi:unnamed protein product [Auanema sp. JU1783]|nr:unnamed protein product [Auanema sp. JU1783]